MRLYTFWTPCLVYNDVSSGSRAVAGYTIAASLVMMTFTIYMMCGGDSSEIYFPFFEADIRNSLIYYGILTCLFFIYMIGAACLLIHGIKVSLRGYLLPWLCGMMFIILFQIIWPIWLLYAYYIYIQMVIPVIVYWLWAAYNYYCWLCVYSQYKILYRLQSPDIEIIYPY